MADSFPVYSVVELVAAIARALVDKPDEVSVNETPTDSYTALRLRVDPTDVGNVIGKQGRTARSMRTILAGLSTKLDRFYSLEIMEGVGQDVEEQ
jgi:predicted RNA-binding protein YlqC (UPF0109 family)